MNYSSYHVERNAENRLYIQSATLIQNIRTDVSETDRLRIHFVITSRMMKEHASRDNDPPTLGIIAIDRSRVDHEVLPLSSLSTAMIIPSHTNAKAVSCS